MQKPNKHVVRKAIRRLIAGKRIKAPSSAIKAKLDVARLTLTTFIGFSIYRKLYPGGTKARAGDLSRWLNTHGYSRSRLIPWLYDGPKIGSLPRQIVGWAEQIQQALEHGTCNCCSCAFSPQSKKAAIRRCQSNHHLTRDNLAKYAATARSRVMRSFKAGKRVASPEELKKAIAYHSDPVNYVRRAAHGNTDVVKYNRDFGYSMLAVVFSTPDGTSLRIGSFENAAEKIIYVLYDTRPPQSGERLKRGRWPFQRIVCEECRECFSPLTSVRCGHLLVIEENVQDQEPDLVEVELARCMLCAAHWHWLASQKTCPACHRKRRKVRIKILQESPSGAFHRIRQEAEEV